MKLSIKQNDRKEFFGDSSISGGIIALIIIYLILIIGMFVIVPFDEYILLPFWYFCLKILPITLVLFVPGIIYIIIKNNKLNKALYEFQQKFELFTYYKRFESYEEFEKSLFEKSENTDFTGIKIFCKDDLYNPQKYIKKSIYAVYINKIIENYLDYFNANNKGDKVIKSLSLFEIEDVNVKKVKKIFIEDRTQAFINYFLYKDNFTSIDETLDKIEQYSNVYKKEKDEPKNLTFNTYTFADIDKIIKENVKAKSFTWIIPVTLLSIFFSAILAYFAQDRFEPMFSTIAYVIFICLMALILSGFIALIVYIIKLTKNEKDFFEIAKYLPITKEEFKNLNIKKYSEVENFVYDLFNEKISLPQRNFNETLSNTLKIYLIEHIETDEIAKELFENSFIVYNEDKDPDYFDLIDFFADCRTKELANVLEYEDEQLEPIEKTLNDIIIYNKANRKKYDFLAENKKVSVAKFTAGDFD